MKKLWILSLLLTGIFLTSCGSRGISAEDAGELFIDRLVYQKEKKQFAKDFQEGKRLGKKLDKNSKVFEKNFSKGLSSAGANVPEKQAGRLMEELLKQVKKKTDYKIVQVEETKNGATISYYVTGLDLVSAMREMTRQLIKDTLDNPTIAKNDQKALEATFAILEKRIKAIRIKADPVELKIHLEKKKGKWLVPKNQKEQVFHVFMSFISGTKNADEMDKELEEAINEVAKDFLGSVGITPSLNGY